MPPAVLTIGRRVRALFVRHAHLRGGRPTQARSWHMIPTNNNPPTARANRPRLGRPNHVLVAHVAATGASVAADRDHSMVGRKPSGS